MGYVKSHLLSGEQVEHQAHVHWKIYIPGVVLLPVVIGLYFLMLAGVRAWTTELAVTNKRVVAKRGLIFRETVEMNLAKIESIDVEQSVIGRLLNYGTITVVGTGGTHEPFCDIARPLEFRKAVQIQSH